jgi:small subunit ribosomal protein S6e
MCSGGIYKMAEFKLNIGDPSSKKTLKKDVKEAEAEVFLGTKIGDSVKGDSFGLSGYELVVTGGSDSAGFPMRKDVMGGNRKKILIVKGVGLRKNEAGRKVRRTVAGNTVTGKTVQINLRVTKQGKTPLFEEPKAEEPAEEVKAEAKAE